MKLDGKQAWIWGTLLVFVGMSIFGQVLLYAGAYEEVAADILALDKDVVLLVLGYLFRMGVEKG